MLFAPLLGWRHVSVRDRRTAKDFAHVLRDLADGYFPNAEKILLVLDNLNTHKVASLYIVPGILTCRGSPYHGTLRVALHTKTWVMAQYRRMRTQRSQPTMPCPAHP